MWDRGRGQIGEKHLLWLLQKEHDEIEMVRWAACDTLTLDIDFFSLFFRVFACLLGHMFLLPFSDTCAHKATLSPPLTHRLGLTQACGHMMRQTAHRRVIISLLGLCLWGHGGTRTVRVQMLQVHTSLSSALWNMCVQCDNDTETHSAHT